MTDTEAITLANMAAGAAGLDVSEYREPTVRLDGTTWRCFTSCGHQVVPGATSPSELIRAAKPVSPPEDDCAPIDDGEKRAMRQADRGASDAGWLPACYEKGELIDHGDAWSMLY